MISKSNFIALMMLVILLTGCQVEEKSRHQIAAIPAVEVRTAVVSLEKGHLRAEVAGTVRSVRQAVIAAKVTGTIETMPVVLGASVNMGDLLLTISAEEISARKVQAHIQLEQAERNLAREKKLLERNAATAESVASLEEMYRLAEAADREASIMMNYTRITAPFDGVITAKIGNVGDLATPGKSLLKLEDDTELQVEASFPEELIRLIQLGDTLTVVIPIAAREIQGRIAEVAPTSDPLSRTATVKLHIDPQPEIRPGQFARVIIPGTQEESFFVTSSAIQTFGQMEQVFVIKDNKAHLRLIRTGAVMGDQTEVLAGLQEGEMVAIADGFQLIDGQPVTIVK
jgi:RND family efflux transporter MFP subunit